MNLRLIERRKAKQVPHRNHRRYLGIETLEDRQMMIAGPNAIAQLPTQPLMLALPTDSVGEVYINPQSGVVTINGTDDTYDDVKVTLDGKGTATMADDMVVVSLRNIAAPIVKQFPLATIGGVSGVKSIVFNGFGQPDTFDNQTFLPSIAYGGGGNDILFGGTAVDQLFGGDGNDYLDGRFGNDTLWGDGGDDWLFGDAGDDVLHGGANNDHLLGGAGADSLYGEEDNDDIEGGPGTDRVLSGGAGADTWHGYTYSPRTSVLTYTDIKAAEGDKTYQSYTEMGWFDVSLLDPAVRSLSRFDSRDATLTRPEMLDIYKLEELDGVVSANELADLKSLDASLIVMSQDVRNLAGKIAFGDTANAHYQGTTLGNLAAGNSAGKLDKLVHKWFMGSDRPTADAGNTYQYVFGQLFVNGPQFSDIDQESVSDCYFLAPLAELARTSPTTITSMFTDNGDGTYAVRFFRPGGSIEYVTVDRFLPINANGKSPYAGFGGGYHDSGNELWVALAEKAYAQINESAWIGQDNTNTYHGIDFGQPADAFHQISNKATTTNTFTQFNAFNQLVAAFQAGMSIEFVTPVSGSDSNIVANHVYAVVGFDSATQQFLVYNPWGFNNSKPGLLWQSFTQLQHNFKSWVVG